MLQKDTKSRKQAIKSQGIYLPFLRKTFESIYYFNMENPVIHYLYESVTGSWQYIVADAETSCAVVIDPVLDNMVRSLALVWMSKGKRISI